ncbi:hypothetical protein RB595_003124 [Gaeumannomyces hyphopodioides]
MAPSPSGSINIDGLWQQALDEYQALADVRLEDQRPLLDRVLVFWERKEPDDDPPTQEQQPQRERDSGETLAEFLTNQCTNFGAARDSGRKRDRARRMLTKIAGPLSMLAPVAGNAASAAFPAASVLVVAFTHIIGTCNRMSEDFDSVETLFNVLGMFVERLQILADKLIPDEEGYQKQVTHVFCSILKFCGKTQQFIAKPPSQDELQSPPKTRDDKKPKFRRLKTFFTRLVHSGGDDDLKAVYDEVLRCLSGLDSATIMMTLASVVDLDTKIGKSNKHIEKALGDISISMQVHNTDFRYWMDQHDKKMDRHDKKMDQRDKTDGSFQETLLGFVRSYNINNLPHAAAGQPGADRTSHNVDLVNRVLATGAEHHIRQRLLELKRDFVAGTCEWVGEDAGYQAVMQLPAGAAAGYAALHIGGELGMGKSALSYYLYDSLMRQFEDDATTSVAYFAFDEDVKALQSMRNMAYYCAVQVANQESAYADEVVRLIRHDQGHKVLRDGYWDGLFVAPFRSQERKLVMVLDGIDQLSEGERKKLVEYIEKAKSGGAGSPMLVRFILTGTLPLDPALGDLGLEHTDLSERTMEDNLRKFIQARVSKLPRLAAHRESVRKMVEDAVAAKTNSFFYAQHTLQRLDCIDSISVVSKALRCLPMDAVGLCGELLKEFLAYLSEDTKWGITRLLVWVAHSKTRLSLEAAARFLRLNSVDDANKAIQEAAGRGVSSVLSVVDHEDGDMSAESVVDNGLIGFRDRSFRSYFLKILSQSPNPVSDVLGCPLAGLMLEMATELLTMPWEDATAPTEAEKELTEHAANSFSRYVAELPVADLGEERVWSALNGVRRVLANENGAVSKLEAIVDPNDEIFCILGDHEVALDILRDLAVRLGAPQAALPANTDDMDFSAPHSKTLKQIAKQHISNWYEATGSRTAFISFRLALQALCNAGTLRPTVSEDEISTKGVEEVAEVGKWNRTARYHKQASLALYFSLANEEAFKHAKEGLQKVEADGTAEAARERLDLQQIVAGTKFSMWEKIYKPIERTFGQLVETEAAVEDAREVHRLFREALDTASLSKLVSQLESDDGLRFDINMCYQIKARLEILLDDHQKNAVETVLKSIEFKIPATPLQYFDEMIEGLAAKRMWGDILRFLKGIKDEPPMSYNRWGLTHGGILKAARTYDAEGRNVVRDFYIASIPRHLDVSDTASFEASLWLAKFYQFVTHELALAKQQARQLLNVNQGGLQWVRTATELIADVLSAEFRASDKLEQKLALLQEMEQLVNDTRRHYGPDFRVEKAFTRIPLSLMLKRMGPEKEFYHGLESTFNDCLETLSDDDSQNDPYSFRMLAKTLMLVPGMDETLAQVALSCQFSIMNPERYKEERRRDRGGDTDSSSDSDSAYFTIYCDVCGTNTSTYTPSNPKATYLCYHCADRDLCAECYKLYQLTTTPRGKGNDPNYLGMCPDGHEHIRAPVEGWGGVEDGMIRYGGQEPVKVGEWLEEWLKTVKEEWERCWAEYWRG